MSDVYKIQVFEPISVALPKVAEHVPDICCVDDLTTAARFSPSNSQNNPF